MKTGIGSSLVLCALLTASGSLAEASTDFLNGVYRCERTDQVSEAPFFMTLAQNGPGFTPRVHFGFYENLADAQSCKNWGSKLSCDSSYRSCSEQTGNPPFPKTTISFIDATHYSYEHSSLGSTEPPIAPTSYRANCAYVQACPPEPE